MSETKPSNPPTHFRAYYFVLRATGVEAVDRILSAVAAAGKGHHHTEGWDDRWHPEFPSAVECIQEAADKAATEWLAERERREGE